MPLDPTPTPRLAFGDPNNLFDWRGGWEGQNWRGAWEGQWFIGVLDTNNKRIYILPISPRTEEAVSNTGARNRNRYASGPEGSDPAQVGIANLVPTGVWQSCAAGWQNTANGHTTHHKCLNHYHLAEEDCLGFTLIKLTRDGSFAQMKLTSNSLNQKEVFYDLTNKPGHSFSRRTDHRSDTLLADQRGTDERGLPYEGGLPYGDRYKPGTTTTDSFVGTVCMGQGWANAVKQFLQGQGIQHIALSMD